MSIEIFNDNFLYLEIVAFKLNSKTKMQYFYYNINIFNIIKTMLSETIMLSETMFFVIFRFTITGNSFYSKKRFYNKLIKILDDYETDNFL
jgi:hypothetical protein